jgi:hypothetical protein
MSSQSGSGVLRTRMGARAAGTLFALSLLLGGGFFDVMRRDRDARSPGARR